MEHPALQQARLQFSENLAFFKQHAPTLHEKLEQYADITQRLVVEKNSMAINILQDDKPLYEEDPKAYSLKEYNVFLDECNESCYTGFQRPHLIREYDYPRFFHKIICDLLSQSPIQEPQDWKGYPIHYPYPLIVFLGTGLGHHISNMIINNKLQHGIIFEPDIEAFASTLYCIDWATILQIAANNDITLTFTVGLRDNANMHQTALFDTLINYQPIYPTNYLFYSHFDHQRNESLIKKIENSAKVYLFGRGNYDDEIIQLNQILHNLHAKRPLLRQYQTRYGEIPICIIGSGPSLDDRIEALRAIQDKVLIVSSGSAISALHKYNIQPDIQVELESSYLATMGQLEGVEEAFLKNCLLLGPIQLNPIYISKYKRSYHYFREESGTRTLFGESSDLSIGGMPTCTNLAVALFKLFGFKNIYLFGMDFGFKDPGHHHAKSSIYYDDTAAPLFKDYVKYEKRDTQEIKSISGEPFFTDQRFLAGQKMLEAFLTTYKTNNETYTYNCSDGAPIEGTHWLNNKQFKLKLEQLTDQSKEQFLSEIQNDDVSKTIRCKDIPNAIIQCRDRLQIIANELSRQTTEHPCNTLHEFFSLSKKVNAILHQLKSSSPVIHCMISGSIWHFFHVGYSHAASFTEADEQKRFLFEATSALNQFIIQVPKHFNSVTDKFLNDSFRPDPWLEHTLDSEE